MSCDTPDNTGKTPDQKPQRLNGKLIACLETVPVGARSENATTWRQEILASV